jgi:uncharacterized membrane protein
MKILKLFTMILSFVCLCLMLFYAANHKIEYCVVWGVLAIFNWITLLMMDLDTKSKS